MCVYVCMCVSVCVCVFVLTTEDEDRLAIWKLFLFSLKGTKKITKKKKQYVCVCVCVCVLTTQTKTDSPFGNYAYKKTKKKETLCIIYVCVY